MQSFREKTIGGYNCFVANGYIFDVRRFSIHDGPGIRTTVFFKGCPLHCLWCHNPESQLFSPELMILSNRCIGCGACSAVCPYGAISEVDGVWVTDRKKCVVCGKCGEVCYADGRQIVGEQKSADEIMKIIDQDKAFYLESNGGVTFSGGEPLAQPDLLQELLEQCKARGYHTALDTSGNAAWGVIEPLLDKLDLILFDLKLMSSDLHRHYTGAGNELILSNLRELAKRMVSVWIRVPIIPGVTDGEANLSAMAEFLSELKPQTRVFLLPYHHVATTKYANVGHDYKLEPTHIPTEAEMTALDYYFKQAGIPVQHGG